MDWYLYWVFLTHFSCSNKSCFFHYIVRHVLQSRFYYIKLTWHAQVLYDLRSVIIHYCMTSWSFQNWVHSSCQKQTLLRVRAHFFRSCSQSLKDKGTSVEILSCSRCKSWCSPMFITCVGSTRECLFTCKNAGELQTESKQCITRLKDKEHEWRWMNLAVCVFLFLLFSL